MGLIVLDFLALINELVRRNLRERRFCVAFLSKEPVSSSGGRASRKTDRQS